MEAHQPTLADSAVATDGLAVAIRHHMYTQWRTIADEHLASAEAAAANPSDGDHAGVLLRACLVAITASAFAAENLGRELDDLVVDSATRAAWARSKTSATERLRQILYRAVTLRQVDVDQLIARLDPVVEARGSAVHFEGEFRAPIPDPSGIGSTSQESLTYGLDAARRAVAAMQDVFLAVADHPKAAVAQFASAQRPLLVP